MRSGGLLPVAAAPAAPAAPQLGYIDRRGSGDIEVEVFTRLVHKLLRLVCALLRAALTIGFDELLSFEHVSDIVELAKQSMPAAT